MATSIHGGLRLDANKQRSRAKPLRVAAAPDEVVLPLDQHGGAAAAPMVKAGDTVLMGQPIAQPGAGISAWLHAPVSGAVKAVEPRPSPHHMGAPTLSIVISSDGRDAVFSSPTRIEDYTRASPVELCEHIGRGGIVGLGGAAFPTAVKLLQATGSADLHLLLNGAECEPYISCDDILMREKAGDVVLGAQILMHALSATRCTLALEDDTPEAEQALREAVRTAGADIEVVVVPGIYPAGGERQLISAVLGREVPFDGLPADIGVLCHNVGTAAAVARWVRDGRPLISRIVTITGAAVAEPCNLEARLGTPMSQLVRECGGYAGEVARLIMGGSMMGVALPHDELPVTKATNCLVVAAPTDLKPRGPEMPCIRCGNCSEVCPAMLLPQQLHWYLRPANAVALEQLGLLDCIECGCCDYVCPSQIPLAERFREAKPALAASIRAREVARDARTRYESRNERLDRLESERRAKLEEKRRQARESKP
jgi:electron transport complex protein RnfC